MFIKVWKNVKKKFGKMFKKVWKNVLKSLGKSLKIFGKMF